MCEGVFFSKSRAPNSSKTDVITKLPRSGTCSLYCTMSYCSHLICCIFLFFSFKSCSQSGKQTQHHHGAPLVATQRLGSCFQFAMAKNQIPCLLIYTSG